MSKTKVLLVSGDGDYAANSFEGEHGGTPVKDIIYDLDKYSSEDEEWNLEVLEFDGIVDPKFIEFIKRNIQDYDHSKHTNFYLETETIEK